MKLVNTLKKNIQLNEVESLHQKGFDLKHIAVKPQWITTMAGIITTTAKCNSYLTIMNPKMNHFLVEMSEAHKTGGQIHKLIN